MTNINIICNTLDNFLGYKNYCPDSMITIVNLLDRNTPDRFLEDYLRNNGGLMQENSHDVNKLYCAVFPSEDVFEYLAKENSSNTILFVKHAMEWEELGSGFIPLKDEQLEFLRNRKISLYSAHAPVDNNKVFAPSACFAKQLGYDVTDELTENGRNYGWIVETPQKITYAELTKQLLKVTGLKSIQSLHIHDHIRKIAIVSGGGDYVPILTQSATKGADTYVTGILFFRGSDYAKEHNPGFIEKLREMGINGLGASHYLTEVEGIKTLANLLNKILPIPVEFIEEKRKRNNLEKKWGLQL